MGANRTVGQIYNGSKLEEKYPHNLRFMVPDLQLKNKLKISQSLKV